MGTTKEAKAKKEAPVKKIDLSSAKKAEGRELAELGRDPWGDAPFLGPKSKDGKEYEHVQQMEIGETLCAIFHSLGQSKQGNKSFYARLTLTDDNETKIRLFTPGGLRFALEDVPKNTYVEITYEGMKYVEEHKKDLHQFKVLGGVDTH